MYADLTSRDDSATLKVTPVIDQYMPGVRLTMGPLYLSFTLAEAVELVDGLAGALADLDRAAAARELVRDEDEIRAAADLREGL